MPSLPRRVLRRGRAGAALARQGPRPVVARRLARAGLVDREWYAAQSGRPFATDVAAAMHYLSTGRRAGWSPHPLVEPEWVVGDAWRSSRQDPVQLYLAGRTTRGGPGPTFDDAVYRATAPGCDGDPGGPLGHFLRNAPPGTPLPVPPGRQPATAAAVRLRLDAVPAEAATAVDWAAQRDQLHRRTAGLTSVVVAVSDQWPAALALVGGALRGGAAGPVEVVLVLRRPLAAAGRVLRAVFGDDSLVRSLAVGADTSTAAAWNAGLAVSSGDVVVLATARCTLREGGAPSDAPWWAPLRAALDDPSVAVAAPLVLGPTGTVSSAGLGRHGPGAALYPLFVDLGADELATGGPLAVAALGDEVLAARVADVVAVEGVDPGYRSGLWGADLSLRLAEAVRTCDAAGEPGAAVVIPAVRLVASAGAGAAGPAVGADLARLGERTAGAAARRGWDEAATWARLGLKVVGVPGSGGSAQPAMRPPVVVRAFAPPAGRPTALRWAIKIAAPSSEQGDKWGDVHFAADLAAALSRLGQHVAIDRRPAHERSTAGLDDVVLNLRGLATPRLRPGQVNVIWVISHPDQVHAAELRGYDLAFAASLAWSGSMSASAGVRVEPLLQATDPARFHPGLAVPDTGPGVLFVGNSRGVVRPIVRDAIAAGADLAVYGTRWEDFIDPRYVRGAYLANETVGAQYRAAGVVLNDHWPDMAARGFVSNRVFDAVAAGGRVISDPVEGLAELFDGAVLEYRTPDELARWTGVERDQAFPGPDRLLEISARVRAEHSFDARARTLLDAVLTVVDQRRPATAP